MTQHTQSPTTATRLALGTLVATPGALEALRRCDQSEAEFLDRHHRGDWGEVCPADGKLNDDAIAHGSRILSAYRLKDQTRIWIITEADRSSTCILLPSEY